MAKNTLKIKADDDFNRNVHCLLGLTFDVTDMDGAVNEMIRVVNSDKKSFISTPNLNFLIACQKDEEFRQSVLNSDLSVADGMPIVFMCRMLGIPIEKRVAGSSLIEVLRADERCKKKPINVFFFGGEEGIAEKAHVALNSSKDGLQSVGFLNPGFGSVEDMSSEEILDEINSKKPDFIIVSLGAKKGQVWIEKNRVKLNANIISHLGAVVNFIAGSVKRAPEWVQKLHMEWIWRIKEEPALFSRYFKDGLGLLKLMATSVIPYGLWLRNNRPKYAENIENPTIDKKNNIISLQGVLIGEHLQEIRKLFGEIANGKKTVSLDMSQVVYVDSAFLGLLMMLRQKLLKADCQLNIIGLKQNIANIFHWNKIDC